MRCARVIFRPARRATSRVMPRDARARSRKLCTTVTSLAGRKHARENANARDDADDDARFEIGHRAVRTVVRASATRVE